MSKEFANYLAGAAQRQVANRFRELAAEIESGAVRVTQIDHSLFQREGSELLEMQITLTYARLTAEESA